MRPARVVTVCLRGKPLRSGKHNAKRAWWLLSIISPIVSHSEWSPTDAVLLPAGFFWLRQPLLTLSRADRVASIQGSQMGRVCQAAAARLDAWSPGALLVVGF